MAGKAASEKQTWWVLQAQSGSREALDELFKSVQEPLFRYIVTVVNDRHLAEDVLQEVFIRIYRKLRWLREPQAFRAWSSERTERNFKRAFFGAGLVETAFIVSFILMADLSNRLHPTAVNLNSELLLDRRSRLGRSRCALQSRHRACAEGSGTAEVKASIHPFEVETIENVLAHVLALRFGVHQSFVYE